jgi:ribose transport system ATP-binding protein
VVELKRLEARGVRKRFGPTLAVDGVDFSVSAGEVRALVGENGAGKSTLVNVLSGVFLPDDGALFLDGEAYRPASPRDARDQGVLMVHQELALAPHLSVAENIFLGTEPTRRGLLQRGEMRARAAAALAELEHDDIVPEQKVRTLSLASRQIVEIARALILEAKVLILDEPTSSLSQPDVEKLFRLIGRLKERGLAIVYISHFLEEVWQVADSFTVLRDGRSVDEGQIAEASASAIVKSMVGRDISELFPRTSRSPGDVVLEVEGLAGMDLPHDVSFELRRGEVLGIAGLMGAGRTEMVRAIFGLEPVRSGRVRVGQFESAATPTMRLEQGVGLLSEDRQGEGLAVTRTIAENLTLSRLPRWLRPSKLDAAAAEWIAKLGIHSRGPRQRVEDLSGGNQQKVALARLLYHGLDVLLLDEPTRGVDVGSKVQIYELIDALASSGKSILLISSYLPELLGMSDRIAVMSRGRLAPARPVNEVDEEQIMQEAVS